MANQYDHQINMKQNVSSTQSIFPPNSNSTPESTSSTQPPAYTSQSPPVPRKAKPQYYQPQTPDMGYPQPCASPPGGQPYYPQPGVVYPDSTVPNYQPLQPQQQQQQHTVVFNTQPILGVTPFVTVHPSVSMVGAIVLSCIAFWCFGWLFGGIAFILAMVAQSSAAAGDHRSAIQLRNASYGLSIAGIVIGIIIIGVVGGIYNSYYRTRYYGSCYNGYTYYNC